MKSKEDVEALEKLIGQLKGLHSELTVLAKKSPSDAVNRFKLSLINSVIKNDNAVLGEKYMPFQGFESFDSEDVPSTSDVAMVLTQYMEEAERYRSDNVRIWQGDWVYVVDGRPSEIKSGRPSKVGR
jgi:hypothetical protein